ncbi:PTS sugar transporter subunit IIA [Mycoplasmopsis pullorum]|uniref:PTS sugar transporter subunit IIA n=1 Tax=Mycoplasmopsis pullorum TaxID=48003 RepID=UPI001117B09E|nr:PTS sugar transporter subunit IIA [Mycoplasmopsis pullorum]TNK81633.1 PTS sugar transporter subunit IIA [Mycoplasmopsis pullorum]TNK83188.1 PTS sugar transporter subunit IIA [Mycoplasmopsis pullorum]TNK84384.1 PTS sugar transporter subunit IIA [Mycoplasmopsis pullorum]TNK84686.1 PTS sugar transporter subunit IIA [Mycoplasmopsis pullorum]TNK85576.1 PTS sugar transporter subunit IIA [Mycoplasmopsis pullorum]
MVNLRKLVHADSIFLNVDVSDYQDALSFIAQKFYEKGYVEDSERFFKALMYREDVMSTALSGGIALPHGISSTVLKPTLGIFILNTGVDWNALDDQPVNVIFALALNKEDRDLQIDALQELALCSLDNNFLNDLLAAKSVDDVLNIFDGIDEKVIF